MQLQARNGGSQANFAGTHNHVCSSGVQFQDNVLNERRDSGTFYQYTAATSDCAFHVSKRRGEHRRRLCGCYVTGAAVKRTHPPPDLAAMKICKHSTKVREYPPGANSDTNLLMMSRARARIRNATEMLEAEA